MPHTLHAPHAAVERHPLPPLLAPAPDRIAWAILMRPGGEDTRRRFPG